MPIKITYTDIATNTILGEVTLSDAQIKALNTDMISIKEWVTNAFRNKARQCIDKVCTEALQDETNTILTTTEKEEIVTDLATAGKIISTVKQVPPEIKAKIVSYARVLSAAEKQAEAELVS